MLAARQRLIAAARVASFPSIYVRVAFRNGYPEISELPLLTHIRNSDATRAVREGIVPEGMTLHGAHRWNITQ